MTAEVPLSAPVRPRLRRLMRSLVFRLAVLAAAFIVVPVVLYGEFRAADASRRAILLESIREKGAVIGRALSPVLARADAVPYARLNEELSRYSTGSVALKLLFRPAASADPLGFFYVASTPPVAPAGLNIERRRLIDTGILDRVGKSCEGNIPLALRVELPEGRTELLTSVAPVRTSGGCWALVVSSALDEIGDVALGLPYWRSPEVQIAAAAYLVLAVIVLGIFFDLWRSLLRFGRTARAVRAGADDGRFAERNTVPELAEVAVDFDRMVETLRRSAINIRRAAEDSAHAFKTPLGIIRQSLEPLRRAEGDPSVGRSARSIDAAVDRLEGLVAAARRLDRTTADLLDQPREPVDLGTLVRGLVAGYGETLPPAGPRLAAEIADGVVVLGGADLIETVVENLVDNALSFTPVGGAVHLRLVRHDGRAVLTVEDDGPGVPPDRLERIFDRYYSERPPAGAVEVGAQHFGIGLWIVRRNVETLGGRVAATNRPGGGLSVRIELPGA